VASIISSLLVEFLALDYQNMAARRTPAMVFSNDQLTEYVGVPLSKGSASAKLWIMS
jgi:hypothetical protein